MARFCGRLSAHPDDRFVLVVSRFNQQVTGALESGARDYWERQGVDPGAIDVVEVPGALELAVAVEHLLTRGYAGIVCLGAIIRGDTPHFDYVSASTAARLADLAGRSRAPVVFGVLTCDTMEQARDRAGGKAGNKGAEAAAVALEMADLVRQLSAAGSGS